MTRYLKKLKSSGAAFAAAPVCAFFIFFIFLRLSAETAETNALKIPFNDAVIDTPAAKAPRQEPAAEPEQPSDTLPFLDRIRFDIREARERIKDDDELKGILRQEEELSAYLTARELYERELYSEAALEFLNMIKANKDSVLKKDIYYSAAECYFALKDYKASEENFRKIASDGADTRLVPEASLMIARIYFEKNELNRAVVESLRAARSYPESGIADDALLVIGDAYREKKDYGRALIEYYKVMSDHPASDSADDALYSIADIYDRVKEFRDYERAVEMYEKLVKRYPKSVWVGRARDRIKYIKENFL